MKNKNHTLALVEKFIENGIRTIPIRWEAVEKGYRLLIEERLKRAGYELTKHAKGVRTYTLKEEQKA